MSRSPEVFDVTRVELHRGINLVEASAGTGKTYAIAMLVLRLVGEQAIPIERILVVTFTKAATAELRERVRKRLVEARDILLDGPAGQPDPVLQAWVETLTDRRTALQRVQAAVSGIDRAAILTIHGFCQRMLQEQALESRQLFTVDLVPDPEEVRRQVVHDFWRRLMYRGHELLGAVVGGLFPGPDQLLRTVAGIGGGIAGFEPETGPPAGLASRLDELYRRLRLWWDMDGDRLRGHFVEAIAVGMVKKDVAAGFDEWWQQVDAFFGGRRLSVPDHIGWLGRPGLTGMLNGTRLRGGEKKAAYLAAWPLADQLIAEWLDLTDEIRLAVRVALAGELRDEVVRRLRRQGAMSYDDLVLSLAAALDGEDGRRLRVVLAERFAAALIDEFQDTDTHQWRIFSAVFGEGDHFLYLIGDPKQAIYRFRGADIHAYFAARRQADRVLTLDRNFRSHPRLVAAVNRLFEGDNPFLFTAAELPCPPVQAARTAADGAVVADGGPLPPLLYCHLPPPGGEPSGRWSSGAAAERIRAFVVGEICRLLDDGGPQVSAPDGARPLAARDIAILVRTNRQAEEFQQALIVAGLPAVVASRTSVFATEECGDILRLLHAIHQPGSSGRMKAALTSRWFGLSGQQLETMWHDEAAVDGWRLRFQDYGRRWEEDGPLAMMRTLLQAEQVLSHLAGDERGERRIANIFHLLELIQEQAAAGFGPARLLQWLQMMRGGNGEGREEYELRLESDDAAVQVMTMHGVKGLEYPLVFCPFLWYRSNWTAREKEVVTFHDGANRLLADLGSADFAARREWAEREELSEDLRLLYVAVTRARLRCWVVWADVRPYSPVADSFDSALGHLLFPGGAVDEPGQIARLQSLAGQAGVAWQRIDPDASPPLRLRGDAAVAALACRQPSSRSLLSAWRMTSYSALAGQSVHEEGRAVEGQGEVVATAVIDAQAIEVPGLPAGARFGNVVHDLLEQLPFAGLARERDLATRLPSLVGRYRPAGEPGRLAALLANTVGARLSADPRDGTAFTLAELAPDRMMREMPFYMHLDRMTTAAVNAILKDDPAVLPLSRREMQGYLTGFIDLVCEHGGRFFIVDYKTNNLGERQGDYLPDRLVLAMRQHNYGLQYWIYSLVLHRHLRNLLPDYDYQKHFGGVMYLFVRGMSRERPGAGVYHVRPDASRLQALDALLGGNR